MSTDTIRPEEKQTEQGQAGAAERSAAALASIVNKVKTDSQQDAGSYLEETKVPHGGE